MDKLQFTPSNGWGCRFDDGTRSDHDDESTSKELDIERDLRQLYIPDNYKSKALQTRISNSLFQIVIPNRNYKSVDDNS